jgi:hypothetical protein
LRCCGELDSRPSHERGSESKSVELGRYTMLLDMSRAPQDGAMETLDPIRAITRAARRSAVLRTKTREEKAWPVSRQRTSPRHGRHR